MKSGSLLDLQEKIRRTRRGPYWHNIVGLTLMSIAEKYGVKAANDTIDKFELQKKGWRKEPEPTLTGQPTERGGPSDNSLIAEVPCSSPPAKI